MKKWDYAALTVDENLRVSRMNGELVEQVTEEQAGLFGGRTQQKVYPRLHPFLQGLGKEGWEICGMTPYHTGSGGQIYYLSVILKRPIDE